MEANKGEFPQFRIHYVPPTSPSHLHDLTHDGPGHVASPTNPFATEQADFARGRASALRFEQVGLAGRARRNLQDSVSLSREWRLLASQAAGPWQLLHDATTALGPDGQPNLAALRQAQVRLHQWLRQAQADGKKAAPVLLAQAAKVDALVGRMLRRNAPLDEIPATAALQPPPDGWQPLRQLVGKVLPASPKALHRQAMALWQDGRSAEAVALLEAACERQPRNVRLQIDRARVLTDEGYYADAEWALSELAADHPRHAGVHAALGELFLQMGQPLLATESFRQAVRHDPGHTDAHVQLGVSLYEQGQIAEAVPHLQAAIRLDQASVVARFYMAQVSLQQNDVLRARYQLGMVAKLDPSLDLTRFGENAPPPLIARTERRVQPVHHWQVPRAAQTSRLDPRQAPRPSAD